MIRHCFGVLLDMSRTASVVILIVLIARLLLKKAPKIFSYGLWMIVLFRLLLPFSFESPVSLIPKEEILDAPPVTAEASSSHQEEIKEEYTVSPVQNEMTAVEAHRDPASFLNEFFRTYGPFLWIAGVFFIELYSLASYLKLRRDIGETVYSQEEDLYYGDHIPSPFVYGLLHPAVYLPSSLKEEEKTYVLLHERTHIQRGDHIIKALFWLVLCLHWFNPLVWLSFILMESDMEMSCDEKVLKILGEDKRASYSKCLLDLSVGRSSLISVPLAFGEGGLKRRLSNLFHYRKPVLWVSAAALFLCTVLGVSLLSDPEGEWIMVEKAETKTDKNGVSYDELTYKLNLEEKPKQICLHIKQYQDNMKFIDNVSVIDPSLYADSMDSFTLRQIPVDSFVKAFYLAISQGEKTIWESDISFICEYPVGGMSRPLKKQVTITDSLRKKTKVKDGQEIILCAFHLPLSEDSESPDYNEIKRSDEDISESGKMIVVSIEFNGSHHQFISFSGELSEAEGIVKKIDKENEYLLRVTMEDGREALFYKDAKDDLVMSRARQQAIRFLCQTGFYSDDPDRKEVLFVKGIFLQDGSLPDRHLPAMMISEANRMDISSTTELSHGMSVGAANNTLFLSADRELFESAVSAFKRISFKEKGNWHYSPDVYEVSFYGKDGRCLMTISQKCGIYYLYMEDDYKPRVIGYADDTYTIRDLFLEYCDALPSGDSVDAKDYSYFMGMYWENSPE